jgi:hypothetical protein
LELAEAITIDKSQGQTVDKIAINIGEKSLTRAHNYVACSRVHSFEGLYLYGKSSIRQGQEWESWSEKKRIKAAEEKASQEPHRKELERMLANRQLRIPFYWIRKSYIRKRPVGTIAICVHNIRHMTNQQVKAIQADYGIMNSDILIFLECHLKAPTNEYDNMNEKWAIRGFTLAAFTCYCGDVQKSIGTMVYVRTDSIVSSMISTIHDNSPNGDGRFPVTTVCSTTCELGLFSFEMRLPTNERRIINICYVYNHPGSSFENLANNVTSFLAKHGLGARYFLNLVYKVSFYIH